MPRIRVLVVDDSVVVRRLVSDALAIDPSIEVVGTAVNGRNALAKIDQLNPDAVTLDIEMPEMDGLAALKEIRRTRPKLPVIMFSTLTVRGAVATLDALALGASDYVAKPSNVGGAVEAMTRIRDDLIPKIKVLCGRSPAGVARPPAGGTRAASSPARVAKPRTGSRKIDIIAIGVSTGGPNALAEVLPQLPADLPVPVVIVQHMPPVFTKLLAERLDTTTPLNVHEGAPGIELKAGDVWVAPGGYHMTVKKEGTRIVLATNDDPLVNSCRPAVDVLFNAVAATFGSNALGVVLTGMGQDGYRGSEQIVAAGGQVIAQDEATSVVWGMPGFVANAGLAERVLPLDQIAAEIVRRAREGRDARTRVTLTTSTP